MIINGKLRCPLSIESSGRIPVTFGDDIVSECTLPIDVSINSDYAEITRFGNSTVNNAWEWIQMIQPENVSTLSSCDSLPTELALQFIWADVGSLKNPQPMIVGARAIYGTSGNICTCTTGNYNENDCDVNRKKLSYNIRTTVSFLRLPDHGTELYVPRAPRLIPAVQEDLFYPFFIRDDARSRISLNFFSKKLFLLIIILLWILY
ncbi:hypothetical protein LY90DRAFT_517048 [Neocallimastix californiae]|uniref:Tectonic-1-3 domain-containing protein n=1 Tax=Neocallimastix californiae TaxID=1754190 RepID=A0A1Y2ACA4_9FUNG|nr:hypothetical protein LY90DRAFT_517048 [Neocallimastix californiae]|eukprot:ORY20141.1 hypothetical protein LY90DRAFT_517048 [Neocallimastix californiae]